MRILRVAQKVYPEVAGGGPYHVHALSRDQAKMGHDVTVLTVGDGPRQSERYGYTVIRCPPLLTPLGNAIAPGIAWYLRRIDSFDVIHAHSHLYASTNFAAIARSLGSTPLAITNHGLYSQTAPEWVFDEYLRTIGRWTFNQGDIVFCYTEADKNRLRERGVESNIQVVPNGVDPDRFNPIGQGCEAIDGDPAIVFVGRLVDGKRPTDAVKTLARLKERQPGAELSFVGKGPLESKVREVAADFGVCDAITLVGQVPYDSMPSIYRAADVLLLTSRAEGLPRTVLEAMASDRPVVTTNLPQIAAVVAGAGRTVDIGDIDGFAIAIEEVLDGTDESPRSVATEYDWSQTVRRTTDILQTVSKTN